MTQDIFNDPTYPHAYVCSADDINAGVSGLPAAGHWRILYIPYFASDEGWSVQVAVGAVANSGLCWRKASGTVWGSWESAATATPPQEFDLPLAAGWSNYGVAVSRYRKNQFREVSVAIDITNTGAITSGSTVATLPVGFRPTNPFDVPAIISNDPKGIGKCYFRSNGEIVISGAGTASWDRVDYFTAQASFVAAD